MIEAVKLAKCNTSFCSEKPEKIQEEEHTRILPNTPETRIKQRYQRTTSAFLDYPVRGLKGDINSNFYEFLTMGIVPYLAGSAMFMFVFNVANKYQNLFNRAHAATYGKKMALGVVLYGIFKEASKNLVTEPVKLATGVDTEMPYENIVYPLPKEAGKAAKIEVQHQQRKVFDSKEFYRKDLLDREYYDKVAKKLGLGENLKDPVTEASPIIQNVVATTNTAKSLSSYAWAAVGVGLAVQDSWKDFFNTITNAPKYTPKKNDGFMTKVGGWSKNAGKNVWDTSVSFVRSLGHSFEELWNGKTGSKYMKHAGKALIGLATLLTLGLTSNAIIRAKENAKNKNRNTIDKAKESTVI